MKHLMDEQLADWLAGEAAAETLAHLQQCERCHAEAMNLREGIARYSFSLRLQAARAQSARLAGIFSPGKVVRHRLRWAGAGVLGLLLAAQTVWMTMPHRNPPSAQPTATAPPAAAAMSDDELLEAVNNDLSRDVPQALAPVSAITAARNKIAASTEGNLSSKQGATR
jgi:hypothetical protein